VLNGDLTMTGRVEVQTFLGATTRLLVRESKTDTDAGPGLVATRLLAVDVPSANAGRWPAGSELRVRIPVGASRVIADRSAAAAASVAVAVADRQAPPPNVSAPSA
jgi:hypothetical protein